MNPMREQIRSLLRVESCDGGFSALLNVDSNLAVLSDHFKGFPLLPGICMIQAVVLAGATRQGVSDLSVRMLKYAKFMQPVRPGEQLVIEADMISIAADEFSIKASLSVGERRCAEISLVVGLDAAQNGARP
jgi:3-hydroxymyristoyl/3-hydroxydecanoyl-(acyl carrier protein) dehydratase